MSRTGVTVVGLRPARGWATQSVTPYRKLVIKTLIPNDRGQYIMDVRPRLKVSQRKSGNDCLVRDKYVTNRVTI